MARAPLAVRPGPGTRVLIVGFGKMGQLHLGALRSLPEAEVIGVVDTDAGRKIVADAQGVPFARTVDDWLASTDAAIVATPSDDHAATCIRLLRLGIDCLVEKPIALDLGDARRMVEAAGDHTILAVGQSERFNPGLERALEVMRSVHGDVVVRRTARLAPEESASDVVQDLMVHDLDWILRHEGFASPGVEIDRAMRTSGKLASVTCRLRFAARTYEVTSHYADGISERTVTLLPKGQPPNVFSLRRDHSGSAADPLTRQVASFLALRHGAPAPICTAGEALQVLELTEQVRYRCGIGPRHAALESNSR